MVNGEISWDNPPHKNNSFSGEKRDLYLKLEDGKNSVRFITNPFFFYIHEYKPAGAKFPNKIRCAKASASDPCPLCDEGLKRKARYLAGVIDRRTATIKVLEFNSVIFDTIMSNKDDEDWGPPIGYDYNVKKDSKATSPMQYYTATPSPKKPLTADEQQMVDDFDKQTLVNLVKVPTLEKVLERISKVKEEAAKNLKAMGGSVPETKAAPAQKVESSTESTSSDSSTEEDFPEYKS